MQSKKNKIINSIRSKVVPTLKKNGVIRAGIFGSYARGEYKKNSDIDILIKVRGNDFSLLDLVGLKMELEKNVGKKVDLLTYKSINPHIKKSIMDDEVRII